MAVINNYSKKPLYERVKPRQLVIDEPIPTRIISYGPKTVQFVRNIEGFEAYHLKNSGSLAHILTHTMVLTMHRELRMRNLIREASSGKANEPYRLPYRQVPREIVASNGNRIRQVGTEEVTYLETTDATVQWLKGLIMQAHGAAGFDIIKAAQHAAIKQFSIASE